MTAQLTSEFYFLPCTDFEGSDICERPDLHDNIEALKAFALTLPNCVGFNTRGGFKSACDDEKRFGWTEDTSCGFYRRAALDDGEWEFLQGIDYPGYDVFERPELADDIDALKAFALTVSHCVGFNTLGVFKCDWGETEPKHWTDDPSRGFYRRRGQPKSE
eukprot:GAFH01004916.1.p1 GENE.GAFH01004916.1~~GAFH01004916.1.p1  ORF type:complete len:170 (-),score=20.25 GAFH01004916.1:209-691(-)